MGRQFVFSLRARLITIILLVFMPTIALVVYNNLRDRDLLARKAGKEALHLTRLVAREYSRRIGEARLLSYMVLQHPHLNASGPGRCKELFSGLITQYDQYTSLNLCSADGRILCSVPQAPAGRTFADRDYFQQALESGEFATSSFMTGRVTGKDIIAFAFPALDEAGEVDQILVGGLDTSWIDKFIEEPTLPEGAILKIIDSEGTIRLRIPDPGQWVGKRAPEWPLLNEMESAGREGVAQTRDLQQQSRVYAFTLLDKTEETAVYFSIGIPSEIIFAEADWSLRFNLLIVVFLTAFILLATWFGGELFLVRQVRSLRSATERLKKGDLRARANLPGCRSEIGSLGESFDEMATALQKRTEEAEEQQVRIARLNRVYSVLSGINGAIIRIREQDTLLEEVCRIAVDKGGFRMASIGLLDEDSQSIRILHREGSGENFPAYREIAVEETNMTEQNAIAESLRNLAPLISNDIGLDHRLGAWRKRALECGFRSFGAFPLVIKGELAGSLNLYSEIPHFFDDEEVALLNDLAGDTSLGLEHIEKESRINYLAYYDPLTGIANRTLFNDRLQQAISRAVGMNRLASAAVLKIMRFREVNQLLGYRTGDQLLQATADCLSETVRKGDTVARTGGSEFAIVLSDVAEADDIPAIADKILRNFENLPFARKEDIFVSARLGLSVFPDDGEDPATLFKNAHSAVHAPQLKSGSSFRFFSEEIQAQALQHHKVEKALRHAIEKQEMQVHYQPVVSVANGSVHGAEALLRWKSPELGTVDPDVFIPIAEESGLIIPIGAWVMSEACRQGRKWRERGFPPLRLAVNVAVKQVRQPDFVDQVRQILAQAHREGTQTDLAVELTESALMDDVARDLEKFHALQELGLQLYVDDFGTGYSSLSYLKRLPVNKLKIDRNFIRGITSSDEDVAIARAVIALAHSLGLEVIAEGVEIEEQRQLLHSLECDYFQGHLCSPAISAEDFEGMLRGAT